MSQQPMFDMVYTPFLEAFETVSNKRFIHGVKCQKGQGDPVYGLFLMVIVTPHRSSNFWLQLAFSVRNPSKTPVVRVDVTSHSKLDNVASGAVGDALMLIAELVTAWTSLVEEGALCREATS